MEKIDFVAKFSDSPLFKNQPKFFPQPEIEEAQRWANALRSGEFKQGFGQLEIKDCETGQSYFCCLGVGCKVFIPGEKQGLRSESKILYGSFPSFQEESPLWLKTINDDLEFKLGVSFGVLNDGEKYSFDEIADIVELVYVHGALD